MIPSETSFSIRSAAKASLTLEQLRSELFRAPQSSNLLFVRSDRKRPVFPALCPNCESPANTSIAVERIFILWLRSDDDTPNDTLPLVDSFTVPFCQNCKNLYNTQQKPPDAFTPLRRILSDPKGFAGLVVIAIACLFFKDALSSLRLFPFVLGCFPVAIGFSLILPVWKKSRHMSLPQPTPVDLAIDFTPALSLEYEPDWRAFQFRSQIYAAHFHSANSTEVWNPKSAEAKFAAKQRRKDSTRSSWIFGLIALALVLYFIWQEGPMAFLNGIFN